jgi:hypothetical protein
VATKGLDTLEAAVHVIIVLLGILVLVFAHGIEGAFWQSLFVNVGSSLVVVTILFVVFELFRKRNEKENETGDTRFHGQSQKRQERADKLVNQLRENQQLPVASNSRRIHRNSGRGK